MNKLVYLAALSLVTGSIACAADAPTTRPAEKTTTAADADPKTGINFDEVALTDCLDFVRDTTQVNIFVDWKSLENAGISKETPVTLHLRSVNARTVLKLILEAAAPGKLISYTKDRVLVITTREKADTIMVTQTYPVEDLLMDVPDFTGAPTFDLTQQNQNGGGQGRGNNSGSGSGSNGGLFTGSNGQNGQNDKSSTKAERADALIKMIQTTIRPEIWDINGGKATIKYFNGHLIVTAPITVQDEL